MLAFIFIPVFFRSHQPGSKVDILDLTWEERELLLRHLFAKMNGQKER